MEAKVENLGDNANCFMRAILITIFFLLIGHFYFGKNRTFLFWLDTGIYAVDKMTGNSYTACRVYPDINMKFNQKGERNNGIKFFVFHP